MPIFNPYLGASAPTGAVQGGLGGYETYGAIDNIVRQTRAAPPTDFEEHLADALEAAFLSGIEHLDALVAFLNARNVSDPGNAPWTEQTLTHFLETAGEVR